MGKASRKKNEGRKQAAVVSMEPSKKGMWIGFGVVGVVCALIIGGAVAIGMSGENTTIPGTTAKVNEDAALPKGALPASDPQHPFGWVNGEYDPSKPTLAIWEDFQCPGCANYEGFMGPVLENIANEGIANVVYRPTTFLDRNLGNNASELATRSFGCAIDAGKGMEFHDAVFANQPSEGAGYTEDDMKSFAGIAGITGPELETFNQCVADGKYSDWAESGTATFFADQVPGTPFVTLNGVELPQATTTDEAALREAITNAAAGGTIESGSETPVSVPSGAPSAE